MTFSYLVDDNKMTKLFYYFFKFERLLYNSLYQFFYIDIIYS